MTRQDSFLAASASNFGRIFTQHCAIMFSWCSMGRCNRRISVWLVSGASMNEQVSKEKGVFARGQIIQHKQLDRIWMFGWLTRCRIQRFKNIEFAQGGPWIQKARYRDAAFLPVSSFTFSNLGGAGLTFWRSENWGGLLDHMRVASRFHRQSTPPLATYLKPSVSQV